MKNTRISTEIKRLSEEQIFLKNQRKTVKLIGERQVEPEVAAYKVFNNKETLRHLFEAYAILRGKDRIECKNKEINKTLVERLVLEYKEMVV